MDNVASAIQQGFNNAVNFIQNLISQASTWGRDLIIGIVNGIKSYISAVSNAVTSVAEKIRSVLHFSVPDERPLTDYESWMPDFMKGLTNGIEDSKSMAAKAMDGVAAEMILNPSAAMQEISVSRDGAGGSLSERVIGIYCFIPLKWTMEEFLRRKEDIVSWLSPNKGVGVQAFDTKPGRVYYTRLQNGVTFEWVVKLAATFDLTFFALTPMSTMRRMRPFPNGGEGPCGKPDTWKCILQSRLQAERRPGIRVGQIYQHHHKWN